VHFDQKVCTYNLTAENKDGSVHVARAVMVNLTLVDPRSYGALRKFYQTIRNGDDQQVVIAAN
jgi:hypothetical protein